MNEIRAIREQYQGIWFRSRLEVKWARLFDRFAIRWEYEPQGFRVGRRIGYLPDFWLPQINTVIEVKGLLDHPDEEKLVRFAQACDNDLVSPTQAPLFLLGGSPEWGLQIVHADGITNETPHDGIELALCRECSRWWFNPVSYSWHCRSCGAYDGDHHIIETTQAGSWDGSG